MITLNNFRFVAFAEGVSYLALFLISMPLKYIWGIREVNYVIGLAHGVLFVVYCLMLIVLAKKYQWSIKVVFLLFIASLLPFGTFIADKRFLKKELETI